MRVMQDVYAATGRPFVILIDEWDCLFREYTQDKDAQKKYLDFLRGWLKADGSFRFAGAVREFLVDNAE